MTSTPRQRNRRSFIRFPLAVVPDGCTITSASISVAVLVSATSGSGSQTTRWERVTGPWTEGAVTWSSQPGVTTAGARNVGLLAAGQQTVVVTAIAQGWQTGGNYGLRIKFVEEDQSRSYTFGSKEQSQAVNRPRLSLTWS